MRVCRQVLGNTLGHRIVLGALRPVHPLDRPVRTWMALHRRRTVPNTDPSGAVVARGKNGDMQPSLLATFPATGRGRFPAITSSFRSRVSSTSGLESRRKKNARNEAEGVSSAFIDHIGPGHEPLEF
jgi:hypothetical protein